MPTGTRRQPAMQTRKRLTDLSRGTALGTHSRSVRCAFLSSPRAATAVCSVKSRRDALIIAQHAVLGSEECLDQPAPACRGSRKGRLNYGSIACAIRNFLGCRPLG